MCFQICNVQFWHKRSPQTTSSAMCKDLHRVGFLYAMAMGTTGTLMMTHGTQQRMRDLDVIACP